MFRQYSLNRLLILFVTAGFLFLTVDAVLEHWKIFAQEIWAYVPVVFSAIGCIISAVTVVRWEKRLIRLMHATLVAAFIISAAGLYFHIAEEDITELTGAQLEHEQKEKEKPLLAPLSFAGLAAVGLLGTSRKWQAEVV